MRIGINALLLTPTSGYRQTGVSRYISRLTAALPGVLGEDEAVIFASRDVGPPAPLLARSWRRAWWRTERPEVRLLWEHLMLPVEARRSRLHLFHGPVNVLPRGLPCPSVVTIHDLAFLRWPEQTPARRYRYLAREVASAARRAARVIAVSESTKSDIVELLGADPDRVVVTPLGVEDRFRPLAEDDRAEFLADQGIVRPYILSVGTLEPRKNLPRLLGAFAELSHEIPHDLVLVGPEGWLTEEIHHALQSPDLAGRVRLTGFVDDDELAAWYSLADLFVFPSLYEGFGLPVLEAMACGAPVVTSAVSSLPEVAGEAAVMVDPHNPSAIADGMRRVLTNPALAAELRQRGVQRAAGFTWERTAERTVAVYREAAG